jgi:hypothetical protein
MALSRYLLDTNHAGTLLNEHAPLWARLGMLHRRECGLCRPVVGEAWFRVFNSARVRVNRRRRRGIHDTT